MSPRPATRRHFLQQAGAGALLTTLTPGLWARVSAGVRRTAGLSPEDVARDEDFWRPIQEAWTTDRAFLNLNNGGVSPSPRRTQEALRRGLEFANQAPSYNMWRLQEPQREVVRADLARLFGADTEEIAITRNATEALETATFGLRLERGDEILSTTQDYPRMIHAWRQRELRDGVVFKQITLPPPEASDEEVVAAFAHAITERTRVLHFSHAIFLNGRVLPAKALCTLARERGVLSLVDGAHAFAHVPFLGRDIGCDFYGTSLHKWLSAPFGTGMLFVRKPLIGPLWPLFAADQPESDDIRKLEQIGTHPCPLVLAISESIALHDAIGIERKHARLRYLRECWSEPVSRLPGIRFHTDFSPGRSGAIATVEVEGLKAGDVSAHILKEHRIVTTAIHHEDFQGVRVSPHLYTTQADLGRFVRAMESVPGRPQ